MSHFPSRFPSPVQLGKGNDRQSFWAPGIQPRCPTRTFPIKYSLPETTSSLAFTLLILSLILLMRGWVAEWGLGVSWDKTMTSYENQSWSCLSFPTFCVLWGRQEQATERRNKLCDHRSLDSRSGSKGHLKEVICPNLRQIIYNLCPDRDFLECSHKTLIMSF